MVFFSVGNGQLPQRRKLPAFLDPGGKKNSRILPFSSETFPVFSLFSPHSALLGSTMVESKPPPSVSWCRLVTGQHRERF